MTVYMKLLTYLIELYFRSQVLKKLDKVAKEFVYKVSRLQGMSEEEAKSAGVKIFTFGSYQLGVHGAGNH